MAQSSDWNAKIIAEFGANQGRVGGARLNMRPSRWFTTGDDGADATTPPR